jgi:protein phosphatase
MISDQEIWHIWKTSYSPQEACDRLVEEANRAGGEDNVTVIIVQTAHY